MCVAVHDRGLELWERVEFAIDQPLHPPLKRHTLN